MGIALGLLLLLPLLCVGVVFKPLRLVGNDVAPGQSRRLKVARNLVWAALAITLSSLVLDALMTLGIWETNSDIAGMFLYFGVPSLLVGFLMLLVGVALGGWRVAQVQAIVTAALLSGGVVFTLMAQRLWEYIYSKA